MHRLLWIALLLTPGLALAAPSAKAAHTVASLIADVALVKPGDSFRVGIRLQPEKGWHTYWQNPGDAGASPSVEWGLPEGVGASVIDWPTPAVYTMGPIVTYAYPGEVIHVATVTVPSDFADKQLTLKADLSWLACDEGNCVPGDAMLDLVVPIGERSIKKIAESAMMNRRSLPQAMPAAWSVQATAGKDAVTVSLASTAGLSPKARVLIIDEGVVEPGGAQEWGRRGERYEVVLERGPGKLPKQLRGLLLLGNGDGYEFVVGL